MRAFWIDINDDPKKLGICFGIISDDGGVIRAAPAVGRWMIGKPLQDVKPYLIEHKAKVLEIKIHTQACK